MTDCSTSKKDKKTDGQKKRNKDTDANGVKYDKRKGSWSRIDKAILKEGSQLDSWLLPIRA